MLMKIHLLGADVSTGIHQPSTHTQLVVEKGQCKHQCGQACCAYTYVNACKLNTNHTCSNSNADYLYLCAMCLQLSC